MKECKAPICNYCGKKSRLTTGKEIYPHLPRLAEKKIYACTPCDAYVGCHKGTVNPKGRLADKTLRAAKKRAHAQFDPIWKFGFMRRGAAYAWLAERLGIKKSQCHIGMFDESMCDMAAGFSRAYILKKMKKAG